MQWKNKKSSTVVVLAYVAVAASFLVFPSAPGHAINAGDVMDKMESREGSLFISGAVDMAAHLYAVNGNREKGECALNWYFRTEETLREIHRFFDAHKEKAAVSLLAILIDRRCGK